MDLNTKEIFVVGYLILIPLLNVKGKLSGILAKSGPLDFATKNSFPLFVVCENLFFALLRAQNQF